MLEQKNSVLAGQRLHFEQILSALETHDWDGDALGHVLPQLAAHLPASPYATQVQWAAAVQRAWPRIVEGLARIDEDLAFGLGVLAAQTQQWRLAADCFHTSLDIKGGHHVTHFNLALMCWCLAREAEARRHLELAIRHAPTNARYHDSLALLEAWRQTCQARIGFESLAAFARAADAVYATLLGPHHAAALLAQQNEGQIRRFARLPRLRDENESREWIRAHLEDPGQMLWGVIDPKRCLVGAIAIEREGESALFYYWVGREYRGQGYGRLCLRLLKRIAIRLNIRFLFSSVHEANTGSLNALRGAGFQPLLNVVEKNDPRYGYWAYHTSGHGQADGQALLFARLRGLMDALPG